MQGIVNYIWNDADKIEDLTFVTEDESQSTMRTTPGRSVGFESARFLETDIDREGFCLVRHVSAVEDFGLIEEDPAVDQLYVAEMTALLAQTVGATAAFMLGGGKKRYGETEEAKLAGLLNAKPARYPHADNTDASSVGLVEQIVAYVPELDLSRFSRYAMYNMWRAVSPPPQDIPLAVCDARSVAPEDELTVSAITKERSGLIVHDTTGYRYNPAHRWYYYPGMTRDEVLVFKAYDTDRNRSVRVPHTAFSDDSCPPGTPTRASVEMRGLALFA